MFFRPASTAAVARSLVRAACRQVSTAVVLAVAASRLGAAACPRFLIFSVTIPAVSSFPAVSAVASATPAGRSGLA